MFAQIETLTPRKQQILSTAMRLLSERGYPSMSMRDLADHLGIEPASLYSHFKSKEEILKEIAFRCANEFESAIQPVFAQNISAELKLRQMLEKHIQLIVKNIEASAVFFKEWKHLGEPDRSTYALLQKKYEKLFQQTLEEGMEEGLFRPIPSGLAATMLLSSANWIHHWFEEGKSISAETLTHELSLFILNGIKKWGSY